MTNLLAKEFRITMANSQKQGCLAMGLYSSYSYRDDPKRLVFVLSRYKFVAKMLAGYERVLEAGCADGFASRIVRQSVSQLIAVDREPFFIEEAHQTADPSWPIDFRIHDMASGEPVEKDGFDGVFSLDVLEHIPSELENHYMDSLHGSLNICGTLIIGTPNINSQTYSPAADQNGHVNCKNHEQLRKLLHNYFRHVFLFSMNDEVVHTGFFPMANYLFAVACGKR